MNANAYKLDLKEVFQQFDTSGDGFLSKTEMLQAFIGMGVKLDIETGNALFNHFDPNKSGTVHYGEFLFAFFNRRNLVRQWKKKTEGLTDAQILSKFHAADTTGDGNLQPKEFHKFLKGLGIEISDTERDTLINRFDSDGDGDLNYNEFMDFINQEKKKLLQDGTATANLNDPILKKPSKILSKSLDTNNYNINKQSKQIQLNNNAQSIDSSNHLRNNNTRQSSPRDNNNGNNSPKKSTITRPKSATTTSINNKNNTNTTVTNNNNISNNNIADKFSAEWMASILTSQAEIESKLGRKYYN